MLAPIDKLPLKNDIIQIEITTACDLYSCSNCTRLLPFRKDFRHMTVECFREAVRSLKDWPGIIGIFGGNPCSHPKFPKLMEVFCEEIPEQRHRGIWTNNLLKHGALVREVFFPHGRFNLNAHGNAKAADEIDRRLPGMLIERSRALAAWHGSILVDRKDLGMSDEEWVQKRERCDINQNWSAAIVERDGKPYAYFCEVASSLDGVRGENHGIPVEPGWWRWKMERFENQVRQCCDRGCGVPLRMRGHLDETEVYDMSPSWKYLGTPRTRCYVDVVDADPTDDGVRELTDYMRLREEFGD